MKRATIGKHLHHHMATASDESLVRAINLLRWRTWVGVTQADLAGQLDMGLSTLSASENELMEIGNSAEEKFTRFYGVTVDELYLPDSEPWTAQPDPKRRITWLTTEQQSRLSRVKGEFVPSNATQAFKLKVLREKQRVKK